MKTVVNVIRGMRLKTKIILSRWTQLFPDWVKKCGEGMGVAKKRRRKIVRDGRDFFWCVKPDEDYYDLLHLSIVSSDKKFIVSYQLIQPNIKSITPCIHKTPFIVVMGREFKGLNNLGHFWERFLVPEWNDAIVTPSLVAQIIDWCFTIEDVIPVDSEGNILGDTNQSTASAKHYTLALGTE